MKKWLKKQLSVDRNALAVFWLLLPLLAFALINRFYVRQVPEDALERIRIYLETGLTTQANTLFEQLLAEEPGNIDLNYRYLQNNCETKTGLNNTWRGDEATYDRYLALAQKNDTADIGNYSLGYIESCKKHYREALDYFSLVENQELKYLNNSIGYAHKNLNDEQQAEAFFQREIELAGYIEGAVFHLTEIYEKQGNIGKLEALLHDETTQAYVNLGAKAFVAFRSGHIFRYLELVFINPLTRINGFAAVFALFIGGTWFSYLCRLNIRSNEPCYMLVLALIAGALFALGSSFLYDIWFLANSITPGESVQKDFIFFFFHVGPIEELVKFAPVVAIVLLTKERISDPLDLVILGGMSALGFATLENSLYFSVLGSRVAPVRFIIPTLTHMIETMLWCYLWARARYMKMGNEGMAILVGFCLVACMHGYYDFSLTQATLAPILLVGVMLLAEVYLAGCILHHCIYFSPRSSFIITSLTTRRFNNHHLLLSAAAFLLTGYCVFLNIKYATEISNFWFALSFLVTLIGIVLTYPQLVNIGYAFPPHRNLPRRRSYRPVKPSGIHP